MELKVNVLIVLFAVILLAGSAFAESFAGTRPNIIYMMADDQNVDSVGCYGNPEVATPNMDKLVTDGVIFGRHYNTTAICMA